MTETESSTATTLLVADDQRDIREALRLLLRHEGYNVALAANPQEIAAAVGGGGDIALALLDMNYSRDTTSGREGLEIISQVRAAQPDLPMVAMTAWGSVELAVAAMRAGAVDFIEKPWDNTRLLTIIRTQLDSAQARAGIRRYRALASLERDDRTQDALIGDAPAIRDFIAQLQKVAPAPATVLLRGENGTGKTLMAECLHRWSSRADGPFVAVNMGSVPEHLFESEMFGHARGAFTDAREARPGRFELADGGTLFLDEVANLPPAQQAKLLHVLESGRFERLGEARTRHADVRIVAATNADLPALVAAGNFRRDLYFRLNTVELVVPPLRDRGSDIPLLAEHFLARLNRRYGRNAHLTPEAIAALQSYDWPGNVRELMHAIERAILLARSDAIVPTDLALQGQSSKPPGGVNEFATLADAEQAIIRNALDRCQGQVDEAAQLLGLSRSALYRRLDKYGIAP
mgnify:CR=1 FL=1